MHLWDYLDSNQSRKFRVEMQPRRILTTYTTHTCIQTSWFNKTKHFKLPLYPLKMLSKVSLDCRFEPNRQRKKNLTVINRERSLKYIRWFCDGSIHKILFALCLNWRQTHFVYKMLVCGLLFWQSKSLNPRWVNKSWAQN